MRPGTLYIIAAPSGGGKTTLVRALLATMEGMRVSISDTTRAPRPDDREGVDYHFISEEDFQRRVAKDEYLEYATVYGFHYGTRKSWVTEQLAQGTDIILEIDWQGAQQIRQLFPHTVSIFIVPPTLAILRERIANRKQDTAAVVEQRLANVQLELAHYQEFDYLVVNGDFARAMQDLVHIVSAERLKTPNQASAHQDLLVDLLKSG